MDAFTWTMDAALELSAKNNGQIQVSFNSIRVIDMTLDLVIIQNYFHRHKMSDFVKIYFSVYHVKFSSR